MDASYITPFVESTKTVFSTMLQMAVTCSAPEPESAIPSAQYDVSGIIGLSGDVMGSVLLCLPQATAEKMVSQFVGMEVAPDGDDFCDAIGELINMISGGAKAKFDGKNVSISCPSVVLGAGHKIQQMSDAICIRIPCTAECGVFAVEVCMKAAPGTAAAKTNAATASS